MNIQCKFFLQGRCKYGSRCRFLHDDYSHRAYHNEDRYQEYGDHNKYRGEYTRYTVDNRQKGYETTNRYANENSQRHGRRLNTRYNDTRHGHNPSYDYASFTEDEIFTVLREELIEKEKTGIWPLTAFGLSGEYGNVPGFTDISPEEIRHEFYIAMKNGALQEFNGKWNSSLEQVRNLTNAFRLRKEEAKQIAVTIHKRAMKNEDAIITEPFSAKINQPVTSPDSASWSQLNSGFNSQQSSSSQMSSFSFVKPSENNFSSFSFAKSSENNFSSIPATNNMFGALPPQQQAFGTFTPQQQPFNMPTISAFNTSTPQQEFAAMTPQQPLQQSMDTSNSIYSSVDESKYQSSTFVLGNVPLNPPPKELC